MVAPPPLHPLRVSSTLPPAPWCLASTALALAREGCSGRLVGFAGFPGVGEQALRWVGLQSLPLTNQFKVACCLAASSASLAPSLRRC